MNTWEERLTAKAKQAEHLYWLKVQLRICPVCDDEFKEKRQDWRYVYALPCNHCMYQKQSSKG